MTTKPTTELSFFLFSFLSRRCLVDDFDGETKTRSWSFPTIIDPTWKAKKQISNVSNKIGTRRLRKSKIMLLI